MWDRYHIFILNTLVHKYKQQKKCLFLCFVDLGRPMIVFGRRHLCWNYSEMVLKEKCLELLMLYDGCTAGVRNGNTITKMFDCKTGVRQGDVLSPNLFNLYVNDLPTRLHNWLDNPMLADKSVNCLVYADDLVLISKSKEGLQAQLDALNVYCDEWELNINIDKTKIMIISNKSQNNDNICFHIGENLEIVKSYKYLGLELHSNSNWTNTAREHGKQHINYLVWQQVLIYHLNKWCRCLINLSNQFYVITVKFGDP